MTSTEPRPARRLGLGAAVVVVLAALAVTVAIGILRGAGAPVEDVVVGATSDGAVEVGPGSLYVHVSGAVREPGLYVLGGDARVVDAIAAAGGFGEGADENAVNLARPVGDGEHVVVPVIGAAPVEGVTAPGDGRVDLNTATMDELDTLPRIGPALAERIVQWRDENGRFTSVEDLLAVPGIGDKMLEALRDLVRV